MSGPRPQPRRQPASGAGFERVAPALPTAPGPRARARSRGPLRLRLTAGLRALPVLPLLALALSLGAACSKTATPAPKPDCQTRADCKGGLGGGLLCTEGKCVGCLRSRDCRLTEVCDPVQRRCTLRSCFGDQCTGHDQCALGQFCVQGLCLDPQAEVAVCAVVLCSGARDCNPGQRCNGRTFVCEQDLGCTQDVVQASDAGAPDAGTLSSCAAGLVCNPASGACEPGCTEATAADVCGPVVPCKQGRCVQCAADTDCGPGLTCDVAAGACRGKSACTQTRDCEVPLVCDRPSGTCAQSRPPCTSNESCAADERCESRTGACIPGACLTDRFAPNQTQATAAKLAPGSYPGLTLCNREQDWFALPLRSGDRYQILADADPLGSFDVQLLSPSGALLEEGQLAVLGTAGSDATYLLRLRSNDAAAAYGLRISVRAGEACFHNPEGPHESASQAQPLEPGPHYDLAVCPGETSWFLLRSAGGIDVRAALDPTLGGAIGLVLFDGDGRSALAFDQLGAAAPHVFASASTSGVYFLRVAGLTTTATARYDLTVRTTP